jgi:uncharacterized cupredoxin-like copper-binding protein
MKKLFQAAVVAAAVLAVPALSVAAQTKPAATAPSQANPAAKAAVVHSARGVVKSMDASSLVLTEKTAKKKKSHDVKFVLDTSTQKTGNVGVGSTVQVKYHTDAKQRVVTEIRAAGGKKS